MVFHQIRDESLLGGCRVWADISTGKPVTNNSMKITSSTKYLVAALIGVAYSWLAIAFWGRYVVNHPIDDWLLEVFATHGHRILYYVSIYTHDVLLNVLLAAPAAFALVAFKDSNNWNCVVVAVAAGAIVGYRGMEMSSLPLLFGSWDSGRVWPCPYSHCR
jgi:hypothetical protein